MTKGVGRLNKFWSGFLRQYFCDQNIFAINISDKTSDKERHWICVNDDLVFCNLVCSVIRLTPKPDGKKSHLKPWTSINRSTKMIKDSHFCVINLLFRFLCDKSWQMKDNGIWHRNHSWILFSVNGSVFLSEKNIPGAVVLLHLVQNCISWDSSCTLHFISECPVSSFFSRRDCIWEKTSVYTRKCNELTDIKNPTQREEDLSRQRLKGPQTKRDKRTTLFLVRSPLFTSWLETSLMKIVLSLCVSLSLHSTTRILLSSLFEKWRAQSQDTNSRRERLLFLFFSKSLILKGSSSQELEGDTQEKKRKIDRRHTYTSVFPVLSSLSRGSITGSLFDCLFPSSRRWWRKRKRWRYLLLLFCGVFPSRRWWHVLKREGNDNSTEIFLPSWVMMSVSLQ